MNFDDPSSVGVTSHLLGVLNRGLENNGKQSGFRDVKNAAKRFKKDLGDLQLMQLLQNRFKLSHVSASVVDIVNYPWTAIYTTNYDNGLELAHQNNHSKFKAVNNLDDPSLIVNGTPIIHLHGYAEDWDLDSFEKSCVLDNDSYRSLAGLRDWLKRLRHDIERAEIVVFVGFSANDLHLEQVFFNVSGLKEKSFFINPIVSEPDLDMHAAQEDFGLPLYIGREQFSQIINTAIQEDLPVEPVLASFSRFKILPPSESVPSVHEIEDLFVWGRISESQIKRDLTQNKSDYHVLRREISELRDELDRPGRVVLVYGDICDGKSLIVKGAVSEISSSRPVFVLKHSYNDLVEETSNILSYYSNAVFVVENCFSVGDERLSKVVRLVSLSEGGLILSARSISTEAEIEKLKFLRNLEAFREIEIGGLQDDEAESLIKLLDQTAGWRSVRVLSHSDRMKFVIKDCEGVIPRVLLHLLNSEYVREKYKEEYNKTNYLNDSDREMLIAALLVSNLGLNAPLSFLSEVFEADLKFVLEELNSRTGGLRLLRIEGDRVQTVPSIGARNLLRNVIEDREIVNTTIKILERIAEDRHREDFEQHVFAQFMRYSILSSTVTNEKEINRFFDHISKIDHFRRMPLFWLQWHMAMCEQKSWLNAEKYLEMGYTAASAYEKHSEKKYKRKQLDDRKAKFLALTAIGKEKSGAELFRDFKEAIDTTGRLIRDSELTHHSFETLLDIAKALGDRAYVLLEGQLPVLLLKLDGLVVLARRRVDLVPSGYQRSHALQAMDQISPILEKLQKS
ncbi:SIR2 family protein [Thalassospira sp.]|uniref:SIR2 family protein n=1 Tax=Thalassospira sp. TaxID=1912094 RepID=UPI003AA81204